MGRTSLWRWHALAVALALSGAVRGEEPGVRKAAPEAFALSMQRFRLANGLVVLLAPDPSAASAAVWMSFRAGTIYEPPGKGGLAHLTEHLMAMGPTPDTDYAAILERRRVRHFNAHTGFDRLTFEVVVPAEELPAALWVAADRLATVPGLIDDAVLAREMRVVVQERAERDVDEPYGLFQEHVIGRMFEAPHPLHGGVIGAPEELARLTALDVRQFVAEHLVPANAILTVAGRYDPAAVRALIEQLFGGLPAGRPAPAPALPPLEMALVDKKQEPLGRCPRVAMGWRFPAAPPEDEAALELGARLLTYLTDGAFGMRLGAGVAEYDGEDVFLLELTVPYDETMAAVHADAEGFLRQLTRKEMPPELVEAANLALDRMSLAELDSVGGRAELLTSLEHAYGGRYRVADLLGWHWLLEAGAVRDTARRYLQGPSVVVHARPTHPRPARAERQ